MLLLCDVNHILMSEKPKENSSNPDERIKMAKEKLGITNNSELADALEDLSVRRERDDKKKKYEEEKMKLEKYRAIAEMKCRRDKVIEDFQKASDEEHGNIIDCHFWVEVLRDHIKEYRIFAAEIGVNDEESGVVVHDQIPEGLNLGTKGFAFTDAWTSRAAIVPREDGSDIVDIYLE